MKGAESQIMLSTLLQRLPREMKLAIMSGCEYTIEIEGDTIKFETKYPVAILYDKNGLPEAVFEVTSQL